MIMIFGRLRAAGLEVNAPKCIYGFKEIPYLIYVIKGRLLSLTRRKYKGLWISGDQPLQ